MPLGATLAAVLALCSSAFAQAQNGQLGAEWIPTDLNYGVISQLRKNDLSSPSEQIAGELESTLLDKNTSEANYMGRGLEARQNAGLHLVTVHRTLTMGSCRLETAILLHPKPSLLVELGGLCGYHKHATGQQPTLQNSANLEIFIVDEDGAKPRSRIRSQ